MPKSINDAPDEIQGPVREFWPETEWDNAVCQREFGKHRRLVLCADSAHLGPVPVLA
jgi:hypothetical protein